MHGCRRKVHWVGTRIWGDGVECFHNRPSIPNPGPEIYSNGKTREKRTAVLRGCCAINRIAVKGVKKPTFKGCGTRCHTCRGEGRYGALQGGGATTGSVALQALPCAGARGGCA